MNLQIQLIPFVLAAGFVDNSSTIRGQLVDTGVSLLSRERRFPRNTKKLEEFANSAHSLSARGRIRAQFVDNSWTLVFPYFLENTDSLEIRKN